MAQPLNREQFLLTDAGVLAQTELQHMASSSTYTTAKAYDATVGRKMGFIDRHINYLVNHPHVSPAAYLNNLRIMIKAR